MTEREPTVGGRIREQRTAAGLTQSQLSDRCGIPKPTLSRYENDHVLPSLTTLHKLAEGLGISETVLLGCGSRAAESLYAALKRHGVEVDSIDDVERVAALVARIVSGEQQRLA